MITSRFCIIVFLICFSFSVLAQKKINAPTLKVGDSAPAFAPFRWIKGDSFTTFKKGKVYVMEFGSTWCKPCIAMIPYLSTLADAHRDSVVVISVFVKEENTEPLDAKAPNYVKGVESFVNKRQAQIHYTVVVDDPARTLDNTWLMAAGLEGIPYTIIIDQQGNVSAITGGTANITQAVKQALSSGYSINKAKARQDSLSNLKIPYDPDKLLLVDGNGGPPDKFLFRSLLTQYSKRMNGAPPFYIANHLHETESSRFRSWMDRFQAVGVSAGELYYFAYADTVWNQLRGRKTNGDFFPPETRPSAYGEFWYEPLFEVKDSSLFQWTYRSEKNRFNYSLKVPYRKGTAEYLQQVMRGDLKNYFGYDVHVEERMMPCWNVVTLPGFAEKLKTATPGFAYREERNEDRTLTFHNADIRDMMIVLSQHFGFGIFHYRYIPDEDLAPFYDRTGFTRQFDFRFDTEYARDFEKCKKYLNSLGLNLEKGTQKMKVIVIADPKE